MHPLKQEFIELKKASGWSQAEIARRLHLTRGGVNGIVTGPTVPAAATVELFKRVLLSEKPEALQLRATTPTEADPLIPPELLGKLGSLRRETRAAVIDVLRSALRLAQTGNPESGNPGSKKTKRSDPPIVSEESGTRIMKAFQEVTDAAIADVAEQRPAQPPSEVRLKGSPTHKLTEKPQHSPKPSSSGNPG